MFARLSQLCSAALFGFTFAIERLKKDIADKGIKFFNEIDRSKLASDAGIKLWPSVLLIFGNPLLGTQFITANANAGLGWLVRLLVFALKIRCADSPPWQCRDE